MNKEEKLKKKLKLKKELQYITYYALWITIIIQDKSFYLSFDYLYFDPSFFLICPSSIAIIWVIALWVWDVDEIFQCSLGVNFVK